MSPACATERQRSELQAGAKLDETFHSWVGIIMYLPTEDPNTRKRITDAFGGYRRLCETEAWPMVKLVFGLLVVCLEWLFVPVSSGVHLTACVCSCA